MRDDDPPIQGRRDPLDLLAMQAASGVGWNLAGVLLRAVAAFIMNVVLARLMGPKPFGLIATATVVIALGSLLIDSGLGIQLIRRKALSAKVVRGVFTLQLLLGLALGAGITLLAPAIASFLKQDEARPVIRSLALLLVIDSAGQTSTALLRRDFRFKTIQKIQIFSYLAGYAVLGIPLAYRGYGVWALVSAQLAQAVLCASLSWGMVRHSLFPWIGTESRELFRFGSLVAGSNVVAWCVGAFPNFLIGRALGPASLGFYNRAYTLLGVPSTALVSSVQTVSLSLYSQLQENETTVRRTFLAVVSSVGVLLVPAYFLAAATAPVLIAALLGPRWSAAAPLVPPLAMAMCFDALASLCSPLLISRGRPDLDMQTQVIAAGSGGLCLSLCAWWAPALAPLAWTVCAGVYLVRAAVGLAFVRRVAGLSPMQIARSLSGALLLGVVAWVVGQTLATWLASWQVWPRLLVSCGAAVGSLLVLVLLLPGLLLCPNLRWMVRGSGIPIPAAVKAWIA